MPKNIIAVDADDTLFDENNAIRLYMNNNYGFNHTEADYLVKGPFYNYWERIWQLNPDKTKAMYEEFVTSSYKQNLEPIKGALAVIENLKLHYELVIVTSRDKRAADWTHSSLAKHYPGIFGDVHFVPLWGNDKKATKAKICIEIGATHLIDDSYEHCKLVAEAGLQAILFGDYGWNREQPLIEGITRAKNWSQVSHLLMPK